MTSNKLAMDGREYAIHNPHGKPVEELPVIYGFNNGGSAMGFSGDLLASDGTWMGGHFCSNEHYMLGDLGCVVGSRPDRHQTFREHFPDGYRMEFVTYGEVPLHEGLQTAAKLASAKADAERDA